MADMCYVKLDRMEQQTASTRSDSVRVEIALSDGGRRGIGGTLQLFGGKVLVLRTPERICPSTALSIEYNDVLFVGEVTASEAEGLGLSRGVRQTIKSQNSLNGEFGSWDCLDGSSRRK
jgi:hypothetical protein